MRERGSAAAHIRRRGPFIACAAWLLVAVYAVSLPVAVRASGATLVTLVSGSMAPTYPVGSVVMLHKVQPLKDIEVRDVITITRAHGLPVTHRVVEIVKLREATAFRTKGDANASPDAELTLPTAVIGKVTGSLPVWWNAALWLQGRWQRLLLFGAPLLLIATAEWRALRMVKAAGGVR